MNRIKVSGQVLKDQENYEGLMTNTNDEFQMLIKNKAVRSFAKAEGKTKPVKLDLLLSKLYFAL